MSNCINSSKVYCKFISCSSISSNPSVLIVAKCIVNIRYGTAPLRSCIVLILAKCIVKAGYSLIF
nr:MAG TPA: hypothetical protein [Caudoviricetes sp.]